MKKKWNEGWSGFLVAAAFVAAAPLGSAQSGFLRAAAPGDTKASPADRAYLGVYVEGEADDGGVKLGDVVTGSPAEKAGLQAGDVIVALGDRTIGSEAELRDAIAAFGVGQKVKVTFLRDGEKRRTSARLAQAPEATEAEVGSQDENEEGADSSVVLSEPIELTPADAGQASAASGGYLGVQLEATEGGGAKVLEVVDDSPAEKAGLEAGDVIVKVDSADIDSVDALITSIRAHHAGDAVRLTVDRGGEQKKIKATLAGRSGVAMGGGVSALPATPSVRAPTPIPPKPPTAARSAVPPAEIQQTRREIEELRRELQELRRRCEEQQRTIDAIRRALNGERSPGSTSMAAPTPGGEDSTATLSLGSLDSGGVFTLAGPAGDEVPRTGSISVATSSESDDACCADAPTAIAFGGEETATCTATCTEGGDATFEVVVAGDGDSGGEGAGMVWTAGDDEKTVRIRNVEPGQHVFKVIVSSDGEAHVESTEPSAQGLFFSTTGDSDDGKPAKALKLKRGAGGAIQFEAPKQAGKKAPMQIRQKAQLPMKVKGMKLSPKVKSAHGGTFEFEVEADAEDGDGHHDEPQVRVLRVPGGSLGVLGHGGGGVQVQRARVPGGVGGIGVKPMKARVMPRFELRTQQGECSGGCAAHCPARQIVGMGMGLGKGHGSAQAATKLECSGPCTLVINGGLCELSCEGGICAMAGGAAYAAEDEESEDEDSEDDDFGGAVFELQGVGDNFELMQVGDDGELMQLGYVESDDCCEDDDDDGDDDDDDSDDSCCEDEDEDDINYF